MGHWRITPAFILDDFFVKAPCGRERTAYALGVSYPGVSNFFTGSFKSPIGQSRKFFENVMACNGWLDDHGRGYWFWVIVPKVDPDIAYGAIRLAKNGPDQTGSNISMYLAPPFQNTGIIGAKLAPVIPQILDYAFIDLYWDRFEEIKLSTAKGNTRVEKLIKLLGAELVSTRPQEFHNPEFKEEACYNLSREQWLTSRKQWEAMLRGRYTCDNLEVE